MKLTLSIILIFSRLLLFSQDNNEIIKFRSEQFKIVYLNDKGEYVIDIDWIDSINIITLNTKEKRLTIYGGVTKNYDITKKASQYVDGKSEWYRWETVIDGDGRKCNIRLLMPPRDGGFSCIYIDYKDIVFIYKTRVVN